MDTFLYDNYFILELTERVVCTAGLFLIYIGNKYGVHFAWGQFDFGVIVSF